MKKAPTIREQLGITQNDMAMYLQVSRSQLALFETNKRDLPSQARLKLATIEQFLNQIQPNKAISFANNRNIQEKMMQYLKNQEMVHQHKQELMQRKLDKIKQRYQQCLQLLEVLAFLQNPTNKQENENEILALLKNQAQQGIEKNGLQAQLKCQIKLQSYTSTRNEMAAWASIVKDNLKLS